MAKATIVMKTSDSGRQEILSVMIGLKSIGGESHEHFCLNSVSNTSVLRKIEDLQLMSCMFPWEVLRIFYLRWLVEGLRVAELLGVSVAKLLTGLDKTELFYNSLHQSYGVHISKNSSTFIERHFLKGQR